jgi:hypothetical protein
MAPADPVATGSAGRAGGGGSVGPGPLDLAAAGSASASGRLVDLGSADRRGSAPQRRPSDRGVAAGSGAGGFPGVAAGWSWGPAGTAGVPPADAAGAEGRAGSPGRGPGLAPPAPGPPVPCSPPGGSGGIAVAGPKRRPRHLQVDASAAEGLTGPVASSGGEAGRRLAAGVTGAPVGAASRSRGVAAAGRSDWGRPSAAGRSAAAAGRSPTTGAVGRSPTADVVDRSSTGDAAGPSPDDAAPTSPPAVEPGSSSDGTGAASAGTGAAGTSGSVVTRCQSSTISNGRWTTEQSWREGTPAGSSIGSRTRTRRPLKRDLIRSTACLRRGGGRSMTTASTVSACSADQAWMLMSSVTRPVPWSSARRARPSEGSRRSSTTWRDIRLVPTSRRRRQSA